jgi:hypothetical protein
MRSRIHLLKILLAGTMVWQCSSKSPYEISWTQDKATAISISGDIGGVLAPDSIAEHFAIRLSNSSNDQNMLGDWSFAHHRLVFKPVIAFSRGYSYELFRKGKSLLVFTIPPDDHAPIPEVIGIYPSADTVPENLLKVYLQFSEPMAAGKSLQHITLIRNNSDTLSETFLDLQPELWNGDGSCLTLWLDPGRIKQGLIPHERLGSLLKKGDTYILTISSGWLSQRGKKSVKDRAKTFYAGPRDDRRPDIDQWKISQPRKGTKDTLCVKLSEALDFLLLKSSITIEDPFGHQVRGDITIGRHERAWWFVPQDRWASGVYLLHADPQLEDLSGNNQARPFDRDLLKDAPPDPRAKFTRTINIR